MQSKSLDGTMVNSDVKANGRFLRNVLKANTMFSTVSGLVAILFANSIAPLLGLSATVDIGWVRGYIIPICFLRL